MHGDGSCHGRRKIRPQYQCIAVPVKELVKLIGRSRTDIAREHFKVFKRRRLDVTVSVTLEHAVKLCHEDFFVLFVATVQIPDAVRGVDHSVVHESILLIILPLRGRQDPSVFLQAAESDFFFPAGKMPDQAPQDGNSSVLPLPFSPRM